MSKERADGFIVLQSPDGEIMKGRYRWLYYGEEGATGMTLKVLEWIYDDNSS